MKELNEKEILLGYKMSQYIQEAHRQIGYDIKEREQEIIKNTVLAVLKVMKQSLQAIQATVIECENCKSRETEFSNVRKNGHTVIYEVKCRKCGSKATVREDWQFSS